MLCNPSSLLIRSCLATQCRLATPVEATGTPDHHVWLYSQWQQFSTHLSALSDQSARSIWRLEHLPLDHPDLFSGAAAARAYAYRDQGIVLLGDMIRNIESLRSYLNHYTPWFVQSVWASLSFVGGLLNKSTILGWYGAIPERYRAFDFDSAEGFVSLTPFQALRLLDAMYEQVSGCFTDFPQWLATQAKIQQIKQGVQNPKVRVCLIAALKNHAKKLDLSRTGLTHQDLPYVALLERVESLNVSGNQLYDISSLAPMTQLTDLDLSHNIVSELGPLSSLTQLTDLDLSHNEVRDLGPLHPLAQLETLWCDHNLIFDIRPLASLKALKRAWLQHNLIHNPGALCALASLTTVCLTGNPIKPSAILALQKSLRQARIGV